MKDKAKNYLEDPELSLEAKGLAAILLNVPGADPNKTGTFKNYIREKYYLAVFDELLEKGYIDYSLDKETGRSHINIKTVKQEIRDIDR